MELSATSWKAGSASTDITTAFLEHELQFEEFELAYFLDFCSTLDTCVLHEYIYNIDGKLNNEKYLTNPFTRELFKAGSISVVELPPTDDNYNKILILAFQLPFKRSTSSPISRFTSIFT